MKKDQQGKRDRVREREREGGKKIDLNTNNKKCHAQPRSSISKKN